MVQPSLSSQSPVGSAATGAAPAAMNAHATNATLRVDRALIAVSLYFHNATALERHPTVHPLRQFHVVRGDHGGEAGGAHQLGERVEDVTGRARQIGRAHV